MRLPPSCTALFAILAPLLFAPPAFADHPAIATWSASIDADDTQECVQLSVPDGPQEILYINNTCDEFLTVEATCEPAVCDPPQSLGVENGAERTYTGTDLGLTTLEEGESVEVLLNWSQDVGLEGSIVLTVTFEGFTGDEHNFDAGVVEADAGNGEEPDGGAEDTTDTGSPTGGEGSGSKADPGACGGCATADGVPGAAVGLLTLFGLFTIRRRRRGVTK